MIVFCIDLMIMMVKIQIPKYLSQKTMKDMKSKILQVGMIEKKNPYMQYKYHLWSLIKFNYN